MKLKIFIDAGASPINYELNVPNQQTAEDVIDSLSAAFRSRENSLYRLIDGDKVVAVINTERFICAMVQP